MTSIETLAFENCNNLKEVIFEANTFAGASPTVGANAFRNVNPTGKIRVPSSNQVAAETNWRSNAGVSLNLGPLANALS